MSQPATPFPTTHASPRARARTHTRTHTKTNKQTNKQNVCTSKRSSTGCIVTFRLSVWNRHYRTDTKVLWVTNKDTGCQSIPSCVHFIMESDKWFQWRCNIPGNVPPSVASGTGQPAGCSNSTGGSAAYSNLTPIFGKLMEYEDVCFLGKDVSTLRM